MNFTESLNVALTTVSHFNPKKFPGMGKGWKFIPEEHDFRCPNVSITYCNSVRLLALLKKGETCIDGEERIERLKKSDKIRLTADWFLFFWKDLSLIPEEWKKVGTIFFDGDVLLAPDKGRHILSICWFGSEKDKVPYKWACFFRHLSENCFASTPSATFESSILSS
ncbi:MAG: hypothetical protein WCT19_03015 [Candidatus Paceibacterota bacterium]|jgi:hypothetical protein